MTRMKHFLPLALLLALCLAGCGKQKQAAPAPAQAEAPAEDLSKYVPDLAAGSAAPDFEAPDVLGNNLRLSDMRGNYVVLDFWDSWCKDCRAELPALKQVYEKYSPKGVVFLGVSFDTELQALQDYSREQEIPWKNVCNLIKMKENPISAAYGLHWIPTMFLISPEGNVLGYAFHADDLDALMTASEI